MTGSNRATGTRSAVIAVCAAYLLIALAATLTSAPGEVVADARYEHLTEPGQFLARHVSPWDDSRSLGAPTKYFSPVLGAVQAAIATTGAPAWIIERLTHSLMLAIAASGIAVVSRSLLGGGGWALAGLLYGFGAFASQYLTPSGLFLSYALAPWLAWAALRGVRSKASLRWAALFAMLIFCVGMLNTSSLVMAMVPVIAVVLIEKWSAVSSWRSTLRWGVQAFVLTLMVSLPNLLVLFANSAALRFNLETTETPQAVASTASASESWRGLGLWLSYFRLGGAELRTNSAQFFVSPVIIACGFAIVGLAGVALYVEPETDRSRRRVAGLGIVAALSVIVMVGMHPVRNPTLLGQAVADAFDSSLMLRGFRSLYKAGTGQQFAVALLAGYGASRIGRWVRDRSKFAFVVVATVAAGVVAVASFPFWTANLYDDQRYSEVPKWWQDTFDFFEEQDDHDGVLILPGLARTTYRWGFVNDTLFDAHLRQPVVQARSLPQSTPVLAAQTEAIDDYLSSQAAERGTLAPMLRQMGVRWVIIQNDVDWQAINAPRPSAYDVIRSDPAFRLETSFGPPGDIVTGGTMADDFALDREASIAPVEIFEVIASTRGPEILAAPVAVVGAPDVSPTLAAEGWFEHPISYIDDSLGWQSSLGNVSALVVTDGNQRRAIRVGGARSTPSHMLSVTEQVRRPVQVLHRQRELQSVIEYGDLTSVTATHSGSVFSVWEPTAHARSAIDGDPRTAWTSHLFDPQTLTVVLRSPTRVENLVIQPTFEALNVEGAELEIVAYDESAVRFRETIAIERDGRSVSQEAMVKGGITQTMSLALGGRVVTRLDFTVSRGRRVGGAVGIAELVILGAEGPLDARRIVRVPGPDDEAGRAAITSNVDPDTMHYLFGRLHGYSGYEEPGIARRFWSPGATVELELTVRVTPFTPQRTVNTFEQFGATSSFGCDEILELDGQLVAMRPVGPLTANALAAGMRFESCAPVRLSSGWHDLRTRGSIDGAASRLIVTPGGGLADPAAQGSIQVVSRSRTSARYVATVAALEVVVSDIPDHEGWLVTASGAQGRRISVNGMVAWQATNPGQVDLAFRYRPQRTYAIAWAISGFTVLLCFVLVLTDPRLTRTRVRISGVLFADRDGQSVPDFDRGGRSRRVGILGIVVGAGLFGFVIGSWFAMFAAVAMVALAQRAPGLIGVLAVLAPLAIAVATIVEGQLDPGLVGAFVFQRPLSHQLGLATVVIWLAAAWRTSGRAPLVEHPSE